MLGVLPALACTGEPELDPPPARVAPSEVGPFAAGVRTLTLDDPRGGTVQVEVWYPAIGPGTPRFATRTRR